MDRLFFLNLIINKGKMTQWQVQNYMAFLNSLPESEGITQILLSGLFTNYMMKLGGDTDNINWDEVTAATFWFWRYDGYCSHDDEYWSEEEEYYCEEDKYYYKEEPRLVDIAVGAIIKATVHNIVYDCLKEDDDSY